MEDLFKKQFRTLPQWEKGAPKLWVQGQFETGWEEKIAKHKWLWDVHTKEEMDSMYTETEALLQNFVDSVDKKLTEMVQWKIFKNKQQAWNAVAPKYAEKWVKSKEYAIVGVIDVYVMISMVVLHYSIIRPVSATVHTYPKNTIDS